MKIHIWLKVQLQSNIKIFTNNRISVSVPMDKWKYTRPCIIDEGNNTDRKIRKEWQIGHIIFGY